MRGFPVEELGKVGLGQEEEGYQEGGAGDCEGHPFCPLPYHVGVFADPAPGDGSDDWCYDLVSKSEIKIVNGSQTETYPRRLPKQ